jgi:SAM-dependent methyltransferase
LVLGNVKPEPAPPELQRSVEKCLDRLIVREKCVLGYDQDLASQLPEILAEQYDISESTIASMYPEALRELLALFRNGAAIADLPRLFVDSGLNLTKYATSTPAKRVSGVAKDFDHWSDKVVADSLDAVVALQKDLGMGAHNAQSRRYDATKESAGLRNYLRSVTTPPPSILERLARKSFWELKLSKWRSAQIIDPVSPSLSIGPRWVSEIEFFRQVVGLQNHIGLDLFSDDPDLVVTGDMHAMPFPQDHFQFVFLKNVVDKSYSIRRLVAELFRVLRPGGVVVVDQICGYGHTNPLTRTDIQSAENLGRIFKHYGAVESLVCDDVDISGIGDAAETGEKRYNARLALRLTRRSPTIS